MSVYGGMMPFMTDITDVYSVFRIQPKTVGGFYDRTGEMLIQGALMFVKAGSLKVVEDSLADTAMPTFWTEEEIPLDGFLVDEHETLYRRVKNNDYTREGDMWIYLLEKVVGPTDLSQPDPEVVLGLNNYD